MAGAGTGALVNASPSRAMPAPYVVAGEGLGLPRAMVPVRDRSARGANHAGGLFFRGTGEIGSCCLARFGNGLGLALRAWPVILAGLVSRCRGRAIGPGRNDMFDPVAARAGGKERCQQQSRHGGRQRGSPDHERRPLKRNRRTRPPFRAGEQRMGRATERLSFAPFTSRPRSQVPRVIEPS